MVNDECKRDSLKAFHWYDSTRHLMILKCVSLAAKCVPPWHLYTNAYFKLERLIACWVFFGTEGVQCLNGLHNGDQSSDSHYRLSLMCTLKVVCWHFQLGTSKSLARHACCSYVPSLPRIMSSSKETKIVDHWGKVSSSSHKKSCRLYVMKYFLSEGYNLKLILSSLVKGFNLESMGHYLLWHGNI